MSTGVLGASLRRRAGAIAVLAACACGGSPDAPPGPVPPRLQVVAGAGITDTISSSPAQGLVVQVFGEAGRPESGVAVVFEATGPACQYAYAINCLPALVGKAADGSTFGASAAAVTDTAGRAVIRVRFSTYAGLGKVAVSVPLYGLVDTARFTVVPGVAVSLAMAPKDTATELGSGFSARAATLDRAGNARTDAVTYEATSSVLQVDGTGRVTAAAVGRGMVRVRGSAGGKQLADSGAVTVVPKARVVAAGGNGLVLQNAAGGEARTIAVPIAAQPSWSPSGGRIVYVSNSVMVTDTLGAAVDLKPQVQNPSAPVWSADGNWIYFQGEANGARIYRIRSDGTGFQSLLPSTVAATPSPSPDGTRVAFTAGRLMVLTLATGKVDTLSTGYSGVMARWSPDGQWIAYFDGGAIVLVHPDGTGRRTLQGSTYAGMSWSPDSKWLITGTYNATITDVTGTTVLTVRLPGSHYAWKP